MTPKHTAQAAKIVDAWNAHHGRDVLSWALISRETLIADIVTALDEEWAAQQEALHQLQSVVARGLYAPSGERICACRPQQPQCWYCAVGIALDRSVVRVPRESV